MKNNKVMVKRNKTELYNIAEKVREAQIQLLYQQTKIGLLGVLIVALTACAAFWQVLPQGKLTFWVGALALLTIARGFTVFAFQRRSPLTSNINRWATLHVIGIIFSGLMWAIPFVFLWPSDYPEFQLVWPMIVLPLSAAAVATYYTWTPSYLLFLVLTALPISLRFFWGGGALFNIMGFLALFFIGVLVRAGKVMHDASVRNIEFGIRNDALNMDLKKVITTSEQLNDRLQQEIIERSLAEKEIRKLSKVFLDGTNPSFIEDLSGNILEMNDEAVNVYGYSREELIGKSIKQLLPDEKHEQMDELIKLCIEGELVRDIAGVRRKKGGNEIPVLMTLSLLTDETHNPFGIASIVSDITEQKNIEKELTESKAVAELANAAKDKFFSIISHDLRGAFSSFFCFVNLMKNRRKNLSEEKITKLYDDMSGSAESSYKLLDNLLQWARSQTGKIQLKREKLLLQELVNEMFEFTNYQADQKKIRLESKIPSAEIAYGDKNMIQTVIRNLIANAIKFTPQHGKIIVETEKHNDQIQLSISDTGVGIKQEIMDKLFRIDTQVTSKGTENEKGSGLGLILCKEFVERNGGEIWVESKLGKGTTIRFTLPLSLED